MPTHECLRVQDRLRLEREQARLDALVAALELQRLDLATALQSERAGLEAARAARAQDRERFLAECVSERRSIAEERMSAWAEVDRVRGEGLGAKEKAAKYEARATDALRRATDAGERAKQAAQEVDAFYAQIEAYALTCSMIVTRLDVSSVAFLFSPRSRSHTTDLCLVWDTKWLAVSDSIEGIDAGHPRLSQVLV